MRILSLLPALALLAGACSTPSVRLGEGPREYAPTDYELVLDRWTRSEDLIVSSELDNVLTVTATYESWDFRWAYVVRYAEDYRLTVDQRTALLQRSLAETRQSHQFYVALYAQRYKWNDLTMENPAWIVRLIDDQGSETAPTEIEPIKRPGAIERTYFPYTSPWRSAFRIRFPVTRADGRPTISKKAHWFGLRFAGAQGHQALVWELGRDDAPSSVALGRSPRVARFRGAPTTSGGEDL
ncbi:MAG: hypothetical protein KC776_14685 [Myxococcales bacterium]|nr:hypothetical protein [Myxococcales bacterium]MCB9579857.1 hypothetical protein [Polyangiaceae bacterium]